MFRDLKEYQEIAKIYAEKVSKPENLEERSRSNPSGLTPEQKKANQKGFVNRILFGNPEGKRTTSGSNKRAEASKRRREMQNKKPEKKMSNIPVIDGPVNNPEYGKNMSRDKKDLNPEPKATETKPDPKPLTNKQKFDKKFIKKDKGVGYVKRGTPVAQRAENKEKNKMRAQEMAKKRIADKKAGNASPQLSGKERAQQMAKDRLAKKAAMEEFTPYDIVLEYLLSSEQAATIEEANYVMTEMDGATINSIVKEFKE